MKHGCLLVDADKPSARWRYIYGPFPLLSLSLSLSLFCIAWFTSKYIFRALRGFPGTPGIRPRPRERECQPRMSTNTFSGRATCIAPDVRRGRRGEAMRCDERRDERRDETRRDETRIFDFATSLEIIGVRISDPTASAVTTTLMKSIVCTRGYFQSQSFPNVDFVNAVVNASKLVFNYHCSFVLVW